MNLVLDVARVVRDYLAAAGGVVHRPEHPCLAHDVLWRANHVEELVESRQVGFGGVFAQHLDQAQVLLAE
jgi:hypothetical protein